MKDSGIEWIWEIPKGWNVKKIKMLFSIIGRGTTPSSNDDTYYNGNISWIEDYSVLKIYNASFIVVAMYAASIGNIALSNLSAATNQACCVLSECVENLQYIYYAFISAKSNIIDEAKGGTQPNISQDIIKRFRLPVPSLAEQQQIAEYLDKKCAEIDELISIKQQKIEKLTEYKKSLIYEYVTGKKEVV